MARHLLIATGSCGRAADEAALAGAVALLQRRAAMAIETTDPISETSPARGATRIPFGALAASFADCELLCIAGTLDRPAAFENAALHVAAARFAGVPTALFAVRVSEPQDEASRALLDEILSRTEGASAADAASAARLARARGRRVEVACPLELLSPSHAPGTLRPDAVAVAADLVRHASASLRATLGRVLEELGFASAALLGSTGDDGPLGRLAIRPCTTPSEVRAALASSPLAITGVDPELQALALGCGSVPVALAGAGERSPLHERLGLGGLVAPAEASPQALRETLARARALHPAALARQAAPLRALASRALGALSAASRVLPVEPFPAHPATRAVLGRALALAAAPALERGDSPAALRLLEPWEAVLGDQPSWAAACARAAALLGADRQAARLLERALEAAPDDVPCLAELARTCLRRGDAGGARRAWEAIARLEPLSATPHAELGSLALLAGLQERALGHWTEALSRDPDHPCARAVRACLEPDPPAALRLWRALAERHPQSSTAWYGLGVAAGCAGDWEAARAHLERALALDPVSGDVREALGNALAHRDTASLRALVDRAHGFSTRPHTVAGAPSTGV